MAETHHPYVATPTSVNAFSFSFSRRSERDEHCCLLFRAQILNGIEALRLRLEGELVNYSGFEPLECKRALGWVTRNDT